MDKLIMVAAGSGKRLSPHTDACPKCMLAVAGAPLLHRALSIFRSLGTPKAVAVVGYLADKVEAPHLTKILNPDHLDTNILLSLMCAESHMREGFLFSYSDIIFTPSVVETLLSTPGDIVIVADTQWRRAYAGRTQHPESEAELVCARGGVMTDIGKGLDPNTAHSEFIGMAKFSPRGAARLTEVFHELKKSHAQTGKNPFPRATSFELAYVTDILRELAHRGEKISIAGIEGGWREIDTPEDLERAGVEFSRAPREDAPCPR